MNPLKFQDITTFLAIIDSGSLTQAAERLEISKSIVSKRLKRLEDMLGVALLHRSTRGITPTEQGLAFHSRTSHILQELETAVDEMTEGHQNLCGSLRITAPVTFGTMYLGRLIFPFISKHPRLHATIHLDDQRTDMVQEQFDLAIRISADPGLSLKARQLGVCKRIVVCSPDYAQQHPFNEISAHHYIGYSNIQDSQLWGFLSEDNVRNPIKSRFTANNGEICKDAAIAGLGLAVLPLFMVAEALRTGQLLHAMPHLNLTPIPIYAVYPPTRHVSKKVRLLIDHLCQELSDNPPWEQDLPL